MRFTVQKGADMGSNIDDMTEEEMLSLALNMSLADKLEAENSGAEMNVCLYQLSIYFVFTNQRMKISPKGGFRGYVKVILSFKDLVVVH